MSKGRSAAIGIGISGGIGFVIYLLLQPLLALLIVKGLLPEGRANGLQIVSGGVGAMLGGLWAAKMSGDEPSAAAILAAVCTVLFAALAGFVFYDHVEWNGGTLLRLGVMLAGGLLAALLVGAPGRKRRKRMGTRNVRRK